MSVDTNLQQPTSDPYRESREILFICGELTGIILGAILSDDYKRLYWALLILTDESSDELVNASLGLGRPFKRISAEHLQREPDLEWEQSMLDETQEELTADCPTEVGFYQGELWARWTLPRQLYILMCKSKEKLVLTAMMILEEFIHISQLVSPTQRSIISLSTLIDLEGIQGNKGFDRTDQDLILQVIESDVTYYMRKIFGYHPITEKWFTARSQAHDMHKLLSPDEMIEGILALVGKYGYPQDVAETLVEDLNYLISYNPEIGIPMQQSPHVARFLAAYS